MKILFDTHAVFWATTETKNLSEASQQLIKSAAPGDLLISGISLWEIYKLYQKRRIVFNHPVHQSIDAWIKGILNHPAIEVMDITPEILIESCNLPGTFHSDPADQILVATARIYGATLLSKDQGILNYPHVKSFW